MLLAVIKPIVKILRLVLVSVIKSQDNEFKDMTAIPTLLRTFTLCSVISKKTPCYKLGQAVLRDIVKILLAYTATSFDMSQDKATMWQSMTAEVIRYERWKKATEYVLTTLFTLLLGTLRVLPIPT